MANSSILAAFERMWHHIIVKLDNTAKADHAHDDVYYTESEVDNLLSDITTKLNNFLDVDDTTADQLSEVLQMIEDNEGTIESLTTSKVNVTDIINNLTTNVAKKPLSAAQGVALKGLIDALDSAYKAADTTLTNNLSSHTGSKSNPHGVTASQIGLGNVNNTSDANKPVSTAQQTAINNAKNAVQTNLNTHTDNTSNPHSVTKAQIGLSNVANERQYSSNNPPPYPVTSVNGKTGNITITIPTMDEIYTEMLSRFPIAEEAEF